MLDRGAIVEAARMRDAGGGGGTEREYGTELCGRVMVAVGDICGREHLVSMFLVVLHCVWGGGCGVSWVDACCRDVCVLFCEHRVVGFSRGCFFLCFH